MTTAIEKAGMGSSQPLVVNLAFVGQKPTGLATYAINLVPHLQETALTLLASASFLPRLQQLTPPPSPTSSLTYYEVPANLTYEQGKLGHFRRMAWTQFAVPPICRKLQAGLLFSPVPEIPLGLRCPAVVMVHDVIPLRFPRFTSPLTHYFRYYVPLVLQQARHILCNSQATAQDLIDFYGVPVSKITPIPLAHDSAHFRPVGAGEPNPEPNPEPDPERPYFFYVGRHDPYKNLHRLINAFAALPQRQDYELWIAGSADPRFTPSLQTRARELGLAERVRFLDYVAYDQLPVLLSRALAMVYPSLWEGFGFPVLEAMACGAPVITSNLSSLPEVAGDAAMLVDPYSEAALTTAMHQVASDPQTRTQLQTAGLARASQFSWTKTGQATSALLKQFLV
ncbi:MAG: glycosyltransferase family 4 protein [Leptolyngbya sp. IPPAS B-1204]